jgi:hypothetical protein
MFAGQECVFGSIRACVPLAYLNRSCAHTPVCPDFRNRRSPTDVLPTFLIKLPNFHFLRCNYVCRSEVCVWQHKGLCAT